MKLGTLLAGFAAVVALVLGIPALLTHNLFFVITSAVALLFAMFFGVGTYLVSDHAEQKRINAAHKQWVRKNIPASEQEAYLRLVPPPRFVNPSSKKRN